MERKTNILLQGVILKNNLEVSREEHSKSNASEASQVQLGCQEMELPYKGLQIGLKSIQIWCFSSSSFFYFLYIFPFRALKKFQSSRTSNRNYNPMQISNSVAVLATLIIYFKQHKSDFMFSCVAMKVEFSTS